MPDFIEIGTPDPGTAKAFYAAVFDWTWHPLGTEGQGYFSKGDRQVGLHEEDTPCVVPYLTVDDIETAIEKVQSNGGAVMGGIANEPTFGRFATCVDPSGARFGLHQKM